MLIVYVCVLICIYVSMSACDLYTCVYVFISFKPLNQQSIGLAPCVVYVKVERPCM